MPWGDPRILQEIVRQSRRKVDDPRLRRLIQRAAVQTGIVESGGRNLSYGDADSQGWRQERASLYEDPTNVRASVGRFIDEALRQYDPGERSFELAAQVQRPREDLRGRYGEVRREANRLLAQTRGGVPGKAPSGASPGDLQIPGVAGAGNAPMGSEGILGLLAELGQGRPQVRSSGVAPPEFTAAAVMPAGFGVPAGGGGPASKVDVGALLAQIQTPGGDVARAPGQPGFTIPGQGGGGRGPRGRVRGSTAKGLADQVQAYATQALGLPGGGRERTPAENEAVGGSATSDHLAGGGREAVDIPTTAAQGGWDQYRKIARQIGLKPAGGGFTEGVIKHGGKRFKVQVIFGDQHGHGDHVHVGFRRI